MTKTIINALRFQCPWLFSTADPSSISMTISPSGQAQPRGDEGAGRQGGQQLKAASQTIFFVQEAEDPLAGVVLEERCSPARTAPAHQQRQIDPPPGRDDVHTDCVRAEHLMLRRVERGADDAGAHA